jgi:hypothetical protein
MGHRRWIEAGLAELQAWPDALHDYLTAKGHLPSVSPHRS